MFFSQFLQHISTLTAARRYEVFQRCGFGSAGVGCEGDAADCTWRDMDGCTFLSYCRRSHLTAFRRPTADSIFKRMVVACSRLVTSGIGTLIIFHVPFLIAYHPDLGSAKTRPMARRS